MKRERLLDGLCIGIEKITETDETVQYTFVADVHEPDPTFSDRMMKVGQLPSLPAPRTTTFLRYSSLHR